MGIRPVLVLASMVCLAAPAAAPGASLRGSPTSMTRQYKVATARDYTFAHDRSEVRRLASLGKLVPLRGNADYRLARVSHPYARPQVRTLVERLAPAYHRACGEPLVITSLTRPQAEQPGNAHALSVHPAGMAVDLRISRSVKCRRWLERRLLELEGNGEVDVTREKRPPHYHIAVFAGSPAKPQVSASQRRSPPMPVPLAPPLAQPPAEPDLPVEAPRVPGLVIPAPVGDAAGVIATIFALAVIAWALGYRRRRT